MKFAYLALALSVLPAGSQDLADKQRRQDAFDRYQAGIKSMRSEAWDQAEREFKAAIRLDPLLTLAHYGLGQTYMAVKSYPDAVKAFEGCNEAYMKVASLQITDSALADQRRNDEIRELREAITAFQSGPLKSYQVQNQVLKLESRLNELERQKSRGPQAAEIPAEFSLALGSTLQERGAAAGRGTLQGRAQGQPEDGGGPQQRRGRLHADGPVRRGQGRDQAGREVRLQGQPSVQDRPGAAAQRTLNGSRTSTTLPVSSSLTTSTIS
jgi:tetratricopeptide (TPR) repeat protein